ncbi:hypothetical protein IFM89_029957, partial [Coptis chinensis]
RPVKEERVFRFATRPLPAYAAFLLGYGMPEERSEREYREGNYLSGSLKWLVGCSIRSFMWSGELCLSGCSCPILNPMLAECSSERRVQGRKLALPTNRQRLHSISMPQIHVEGEGNACFERPLRKVRNLNSALLLGHLTQQKEQQTILQTMLKTTSPAQLSGNSGSKAAPAKSISGEAEQKI